jgi:hypothetical protein
MIVDICKNAASALSAVNGNPFTFYDTELYEMNYEAEPKFPFAFLAHPLRGKDGVKAYTPTTTYNLQVLFTTQSKIEDNQQQREAGINAMLKAKNQFIANLQANPDVVSVNGCDHEEFYNKFDVNADGIEAIISVTINQPC